MPIRRAEAVWNESLKDGSGTMKTGSGVCSGPFSYSSRWQDAPGTNPEELLGAAHAGCYSMALCSRLEKVGYQSKRIHTDAMVHLAKVDGQSRITLIELICEASVPGIDADLFAQIAEATRTGCPISAALAATPIELKVTLVD